MNLKVLLIITLSFCVLADKPKPLYGLFNDYPEKQIVWLDYNQKDYSLCSVKLVQENKKELSEQLPASSGENSEIFFSFKDSIQGPNDSNLNMSQEESFEDNNKPKSTQYSHYFDRAQYENQLNYKSINEITRMLVKNKEKQSSSPKLTVSMNQEQILRDGMEDDKKDYKLEIECRNDDDESTEQRTVLCPNSNKLLIASGGLFITDKFITIRLKQMEETGETNYYISPAKMQGIDFSESGCTLYTKTTEIISIVFLSLLSLLIIH